MLENFIYAKTKDLFIKELEAGNVVDEAIVFIEDTKEIWNHGTYFDCNPEHLTETDLSNYVSENLSQVAHSGSYDDLENKPEEATPTIPGLMSTADKSKLDNIRVYRKLYTELSPAGNYWYLLAEIGDLESSIFLISTNGHSDVLFAVATGWLDDINGSLTILNSFTSNSNSNYSYIKGVRMRKEGGKGAKAKIEIELNNPISNAFWYVDIIATVYTNADDNPLKDALNNVTDVSDSTIMQLYELKHRTLMSEKIEVKDITTETINGKVLANVATTGSYNDLTNKPSIASTTTDGLMSASDKSLLNTTSQNLQAEITRALKAEDDLKQQFSDLIGESPETLDTIHEIAAWITNDESGAAAMATQINENKNNLTKEVERAKAAEQTLNSNIELLNSELVKRAQVIQEVTYSELVALRDNASLVVGMKYRITDYVTTTVQEDTKSANHLFDVIVEAISESELSELAQATQHMGDTYFDGNDLGAWQLWYDLDNNLDKYAWADVENGKGVIYRMIDGRRNDCPYDFKNIMFNGYFTFSCTVNNVIYDNTVYSNIRACYGNIIKLSWKNKVQYLNNIVFKNRKYDTTCYHNTFSYNCCNNTFEYNCFNNTFGHECCYNNFSSGCFNNNFGNNCNNNFFSNNCINNTFGNDCSYRSIIHNYSNLSITRNDEYYDDGSQQLVPIKHPDLSTQPSILPYKFMGNYVYELLIPVVSAFRVQPLVDLATDKPAFLSANTLGLFATSNVDIQSVNNDFILLKDTLNPDVHKYIKITYTDGTQWIGSGEGSDGYGYSNSTGSSNIELAYDFGISSDTAWIYEKSSDTLTLNAIGQLTNDTIPSTYRQSKNIIIGDKVTSIGDYAFYDCSSLASVTIGNSVTTIGNYAFYNTAWYNNQPDGLVYAGKVLYEYKGTMPQNTSIVIKDGTLGITDLAFSNCSNLTEITIPNSVTTIGDNAFYKCTSLTSIEIPNSVTSIGRWAFNYCKGLTSIEIPNSVTSIEGYVFSHCSGLTSVTIPNSVTSIGNHAFEDCTSLTAVHISDLAAWCRIDFSNYYSNPLSHAHNLYLNGEKVTDLVIPYGVTEINSYAFRGCSGLTSVTIPNSVTSIESYAFEDCTGLTSVTIPNSVTSIESYAFEDCTGLTSITIPNSVTSIGNHAFSNCNSLTSIEIPNSVTSIGTAVFSRCTGLTNVTIPNSVTTIGGSAFSGCSGLTSIEIPNSVTSIGESAFDGCSRLTSIEIPNSVTSIGWYAFRGCSGLTKITCMSITPPTISNLTFSSKSIPVYVPVESVKRYKAARYWSDFTNIQSINEQ